MFCFDCRFFILCIWPCSFTLLWPPALCSKWFVTVLHKHFKQRGNKSVDWCFVNRVLRYTRVCRCSLMKGNRTTPLTFMTTDPAAPTVTWPCSAFLRTHPSVSVGGRHWQGLILSWLEPQCDPKVWHAEVWMRNCCANHRNKGNQDKRKTRSMFCCRSLQGRWCTCWTAPTRRVTRWDTAWPLKRATQNFFEWTPNQETWLWLGSWTERWGVTKSDGSVSRKYSLKWNLTILCLTLFLETEWNITASEHNGRTQQSKL